MMSIKKTILPLLIITFIVSLTIGGWVFVTKKTKDKTDELKKETRKAIEVPLASPKAQKIIFPDRPKTEKKSSFFLKTNKSSESEDKDSFAVNEYFNISVIVQAQGEEVDGVELVLTYNPKVVKIGEPILGAFFSLYPQKNVDSEKGTIKIIALQPLETNKALDEEIIITLPVTALQRGKTEFNFVKEESFIAAYGGQELLEKAEGLEIEIR